MKEIKAGLIIEMMGRPPEHIKEVMNELLKRLDAESGIKVTNKKIHEAKKVEQKDKDGKLIKFPKGKELFCTFSEIELEAKEIMDLVRIVFEYMPSHVEVIYPESFEMLNLDIGAILNELTKKLHNYDAIAKNALMHNQILANRLIEVERGFRNKQTQFQPTISIGAKEKASGKSKKKTARRSKK